MFLCHLLRRGCLINHSCNFLSFYFFLKRNGSLLESPKDCRQQGEVKCFVTRAVRGTPVSFLCPATTSAADWHQLWSMQRTRVTYLNHMLKVAQMLKDLLYWDFSLEGAVPCDESFSSGKSCPNPNCSIPSTVSVRGCPLGYTNSTFV